MAKLLLQCSDFMWGKPVVGEGVISQTIKFYLMVMARDLLNHLGIKLGERTVEYKWVLKNIPRKKGRKLLDVGCGYSRLDCALLFLGYKVYAIDVRTPPYIHRKIVFKRGDITQEGIFPKDFFDVIVMVSTIEHIGLGTYGDMKVEDGDLKAIKNLHWYLKKGGVALITGPFFSRPLLTWHRFYDPLRIDLLKRGFSTLKEDYFVGPRWKRVNQRDALKYVDKHGYTSPVGGPNAVFCLALIKA